MKALLVDLFGTIIPCPTRKDHRELILSMSREAGLDPKRYEKLWGATYGDRISGVGKDSTGFIRHMLLTKDIRPDESVLRKMAGHWDEYTRSLFVFFPDVEPAISNLRKRGIKIGLLTNCGSNVPEIFSSFEISQMFDSTIYSSSTGHVKPQMDIYTDALQDIGSEPEQTVFIGDGDNGELEGARDAGIFSIKIDRGEIKGDYRITDDQPWDPTIGSFDEIEGVLQSFSSTKPALAQNQ